MRSSVILVIAVPVTFLFGVGYARWRRGWADYRASVATMRAAWRAAWWHTWRLLRIAAVVAVVVMIVVTVLRS